MTRRWDVVGQRGFTLIEVLVTVLILSGALLGLAMAQSQALRSTQQSEYRSLAAFLAYDLAERIRANPAGRRAGGYHGIQGATAHSSCLKSSGCSPTELAAHDKYEWQQGLARLLPDGTGELEVASGLWTIRVSWLQRGPKGDEAQTYQLKLQP